MSKLSDISHLFTWSNQQCEATRCIFCVNDAFFFSRDAHQTWSFDLVNNHLNVDGALKRPCYFIRLCYD